METLNQMPGFAPRKLVLTSRQSREDLPIAEVLRSAAESASDSCDFVMDAGEIGVAWLYGPRHDVPRMWGTFKTSEGDLPRAQDLLSKLCSVTGATYAVCDLEAIRTASLLANEPDKYESEGAVSALHALYWWNYFGPEYRSELLLTEAVRGAVSGTAEVADGGLAVVTRPRPKDAVDKDKTATLAKEWPFFRKYDPKAAFRAPVRIDYTEVWGLPSPQDLEPQPVRTVVGPPDEFIASVTAHAQRFHEWLGSRGLRAPQTEEDFVSIFQEHEAVIRDEFLVAAIAAYGEMVRAKIGGVWKKAELLHRGEPVVAKPGRPWTARRVINEVLEGLEPIDV